MEGVDKSSPYRALLMKMINAVNAVVPLKPQNQVLIVIVLDTEEKISQWFEWLRPRLRGENDLDATETEIVGAASWIGKGLDPNQRGR